MTKTYIILTNWKYASKGQFWRLDASKLDVSRDELRMCIYEQIYGGVEE